MAWTWSEPERRLVQELIQVGRLLFKRELTWGTAGNLSARLDDNHCVITGAGTVLEDLSEEDFARCEIERQLRQRSISETLRRYRNARLERHRALSGGLCCCNGAHESNDRTREPHPRRAARRVQDFHVFCNPQS